MARGLALFLTALAILSACQPAADPPMPLPRLSVSSGSPPLLAFPAPLTALDPSASPAISASPDTDPDAGADSPSDAEAVGPEELASIATETSIYAEPRWGGRRFGYLRAGASIRRSRAPVATGPKCPEGWYHVEPRGYVCVGTMATLDLRHPVVLASARRPRMDDLPYPYALSRSPPPMLYARLPGHREQIRFEQDLDKHFLKVPSGPPAPGDDPVPDWLTPGQPSLSLGNLWHAPDRILLGQARARSGFALLSMFSDRGRRYGVTTGLEVLPLDRVHLVQPSTFAGIVLHDEVTLPIAFIRRRGAFRRVESPRGLTVGGALGFREAVPITGETRTLDGTEYLVARDGSLLVARQCVIARPFRHPPAWATEGAKWIDVSIPRQTLVAYEGLTPVYATLVSTGIGGTGDPKETHATIQGAFRIYEKHITVTMDGSEQSDSFDLRDVPFVQYFNEGFALHAAYWHDDFGRMHSHGCVNLAPRDAAWLFGFTDPRVPPSWHAAMAKPGGTIVYVHD